ncbi:MAG: hypothetical protein GX925_02480, partial [Clostridiales bacterium]|nr:hypothetical protein [Clostridiales bacterium]
MVEKNKSGEGHKEFEEDKSSVSDIKAKTEKGDLEKEVARKYNLNIRQAKDAVENARQIIQSQKKLVKINHDN